jgi:hypothetical protein
VAARGSTQTFAALLAAGSRVSWPVPHPISKTCVKRSIPSENDEVGDRRWRVARRGLVVQAGDGEHR